MKKKKNLLDILNGRVFWIPSILLIVLLLWGCIMPQSFAQAANSSLQFILKYFNCFLIPLPLAAVIFCFWAAFSKYGNIRLGGENAKPTIKKITWFALSLCSGMGVGITYYATYQPLEMFNHPANFLSHVEAGSEEAMIYAMRLSFLEWGLHPYALYTSIGIVIAFSFYNMKRRYRISDGLYPLLGSKINGWTGDLIDCFAIFVIIAGLGTSADMAIMQIAQGCNYIFGVGNNLQGWLIITIIIAFIYIIGSTTGVHKILSWFGNMDLLLYILIMLFAFIMIGPSHILEIFWTSIGDYVQNFIGTSLYLEPLQQTGWIGNNHTFFFTWWLAFAPFCGFFLIKLAYGRTIREFVIVNMFMPVLFIFLWFSVFGGGAILLDSSNGGQIYQLIQEMGPSMAWYALLEQLPFSETITIIAWIIVGVSFIVLAESMTMSLASMSCKNYAHTNGETQPPKILCVFWGIIIAAVAYMLLYTGGKDMIQTSVIICGVPTGALLLLMMISHIKAMNHYKEYDVTEDPTEIDR